jgi:hypothetical protein
VDTDEVVFEININEENNGLLRCVQGKDETF